MDVSLCEVQWCVVWSVLVCSGVLVENVHDSFAKVNFEDIQFDRFTFKFLTKTGIRIKIHN